MKTGFLIGNDWQGLVGSEKLLEALRELKTPEGQRAFVDRAIKILENEYLYIEITDEGDQ